MSVLAVYLSTTVAQQVIHHSSCEVLYSTVADLEI